MKIIAYTTSGCIYCDQLKELFRRANVEYDVISVETDVEKEKFKLDFPEAIGFPYVIIDEQEYSGLLPVAKMFLQKGLVSAPKK